MRHACQNCKMHYWCNILGCRDSLKLSGKSPSHPCKHCGHIEGGMATCSYCPEPSAGTCDACDRPICENHTRHHDGDARAPEGDVCYRGTGEHGGCGE